MHPERKIDHHYVQEFEQNHPHEHGARSRHAPSCSNDDDNNGKKDAATLIGVWESTPQPVFDDDDKYIPDVTSVAYLWYQADGIFVEADVITDITDPEHARRYVELSEHGTWTVEGDTVTPTTDFDPMDDVPFDTQSFHFDVTSTTLTLSLTSESRQYSWQLQRTTVEKMQEIIASAQKHEVE